MVVEVPSDLKVVALFAITLLVWWHFPPPLFHFDGTFRHHDFFHSDLSGGAFCPHFCILTALFASYFFGSDLCGGAFCPHFVVLGALFAPIFMFWRHFSPPLAGFAYSVISFAIASASDITFSAISAPSSGISFVSGGISTSSCSLITEAPTATS